MDLIHNNAPVTVDDLVRSYLRYKDWMDYDTEHSAYCAKEIIVMQALFGTAYVKVPPNLIAASYEQLLTCMEKRQATMRMLIDAVHEPADADKTDDFITELEEELEQSAFKSEIHYFSTMFEAMMQTAATAYRDGDDEMESLEIDKSIMADHFEEVDEATFERIKAFIAGEYPKAALLSFPKERLYRMGLPTVSPSDPFVVTT